MSKKLKTYWYTLGLQILAKTQACLLPRTFFLTIYFSSSLALLTCAIQVRLVSAQPVGRERKSPCSSWIYTKQAPAPAPSDRYCWLDATKLTAADRKV